MGKDTNIEWTDSTINPTSGCDGCELYRPGADGTDPNATCYAREVHVNRLAHSYPELYAPRFDHVRLIPGRMQQAANWQDLTFKDRADKPWLNTRPRHIFVGDMADVFSAAVPLEWIKSEIIKAIESKNGRRHVWQLLTKRPERMAELSEQLGGLPDNVVAMTTVTNQPTANLRIPHLLRVKARTRGLSIEPMRGAVDLKHVTTYRAGDTYDEVDALRGLETKCSPGFRGLWMECGGQKEPRIHWVIVGGESGHRAGPMHPDWARSLRDQCQAAGVAFFFKQWGEWLPWDQWTAALQAKHDGHEFHNHYPTKVWNDLFWEECGDEEANYNTANHIVSRVGKSAAGRLLDGVQHNEMPAVSSAVVNDSRQACAS